MNGYTSGTVTPNNVTQTASATDNIGIQKYQYSHDGSSWTEFSNPWTISWEGSWNFYVRAVDHAGNVGPASDVYTITITRNYQINHTSGAISYALTLQDAINVATGSATVYPLRNMTESSANISGKTLILNSNGVTLEVSSGISISSDARVVIMGNGTISSYAGGAVLHNSGDLQIQGSNIVATTGTYAIANYGRLMIIGGTVTANTAYATVIGSYTGQAPAWPANLNETITACASSCTIHIDGSAIIVNNGTGYGVHHWQGTANLAIHLPPAYSGYIYAKSGYAVKEDVGAHVALNGGTIYSPTGKFYKGSNITIKTNNNLHLSTVGP